MIKPIDTAISTRKLLLHCRDVLQGDLQTLARLGNELEEQRALDAMNTVEDRQRDLLIRTEREEDGGVRLSVKDAGRGFDPRTAAKLFEAFYNTKTDGMGVGLSVSRSIIESHQGRLWAVLNDGPGATFSFSVPSRIHPQIA
jgi:signal transduction histidine kinase